MARSKKEIIKILSTNLVYFFPHHNNHFMCPTCLKPIPVDKQELISEAHITPKSAGGGIKTYLCCKCNSVFGSKQDKWFGELIRLHQDEKAGMLSTRIKEKHFIIDGIRINGRMEEDENGNINLYTYSNRNSPATIKALYDRDKASPHKMVVEFSLPIMKNEKMISVGFLTAGYLMWFRALGYSWVLQQHLDPIREQILNPDNTILEENYVAHCKGMNWEPWIGFLPINNEFAPVFGISDQLVIYPPRYKPDLLTEVPSFDIDISKLRGVRFSEHPYVQTPVIVMFNEKQLIVPDYTHEYIPSSVVVQFTSNSEESNIFTYSKD